MLEIPNNSNAKFSVDKQSQSLGRPRSEAVDHAILDAFNQLLLAQSYAAISMSALAQAAKVSKASVYRRWPNKAALAVDLLSRLALAQQKPFIADSYRDQLILAMKGLRAMLCSDYAEVIVVVIGEAQRDETLRERFLNHFLKPVQTVGDAYLDLAIERGEVRADVDRDMIFDQLFGTFYYRILVAHTGIDDAVLVQIVDGVMKQLSPE